MKKTIILLLLFFPQISSSEIYVKSAQYGIMANSYSYREFKNNSDKGTKFMKLTGQNYGIEGRLSFGFDKIENISFITRLHLDFGDLDYKGAYQGGNYGDLEMGGNSNDIFEISLVAMATNYHVLSPYIGFAYRKLDNMLAGSGGYERISKYYYIPMGLKLHLFEDSDLKINSDIEYDYFLEGSQYSAVAGGIDKSQNEGYGYRLTLNFEKMFNNKSILISPFFKYWEIKDSQKIISGNSIYWEPYNETIEAGIKFSLKFDSL